MTHKSCKKSLFLKSFWIHWRIFWRIVYHLDQESFLPMLIRWARRKQLDDVMYAYKRNLETTRYTLEQASQNFPLIYELAAWYRAFREQIATVTYKSKNQRR